MAAKRLGGADPHLGDGLSGVVGRDLLCRGGGHEEPGVVPPGSALGRDPMGEVVDRVDRQQQALVSTHVEEPLGARVDGGAARDKPLLVDGVGEGEHRPGWGFGRRRPARV